MPLNPFTGEFEGYDSPSTAAGIGMSALSVGGVETPLAYNMLENMPGLFASMGFSSMRGANTLMYGGYMDNKEKMTSRIARSFGDPGADPNYKTFFRKRDVNANYDDTSLRSRIRRSRINVGQSYHEPKFIGRKARREAAAAAGKSPILRPMIASNNPLNPRNLRRFRSTSIFNPIEAGGYTPFAAAGFLGKNKRVRERLTSAGIDIEEGKSALSGGLFSAISAGSKLDRLEYRASQGSSGAARRLSRSYSSMTTNFGMSMQQAMGPQRIVGPISPLTPGVSLAGSGGNLAAGSMGAAGTAAMAGYVRGALGYADVPFYGRNAVAAAKGASNAKAAFSRIMSSEAMAGMNIDYNDLARGGKGLFGQLKFGGMYKFASEKGGAKFLGARAVGLALPGVQVVAAASLLYDVGKMAGQVVKSGINMARDASASMQGSLAKPLFGMGYRDSEAAATSRARGVMAISNSRLNARSVLGSEAAQLAAYYG